MSNKKPPKIPGRNGPTPPLSQRPDPTPAPPRPMCGACHNHTRVGHGCAICGFATDEDGVLRYVEPFAEIRSWKLPPSKRATPSYCPRAIDGCMPLHAIRASDHTTFVCCGLQHDGEPHDPYRMCSKSKALDTVFDHDEFDLLDMIEVATRAMSSAKRFSKCEVQDG